jgi:hypothetical protein
MFSKISKLMFCCHVAHAEKPGGVGLNDAALGLQTGSAFTLSPPCLVSGVQLVFVIMKRRSK